MNTINNLTKLNLLSDANLHYAELQFQPQLNQYIAEQQIMGNANYDQLNDESGFEELLNSGSVVDGDGSYNDPYSLKNSLSNNDLLSQQQQLQITNHLNKAKHSLQIIDNGQLEYAKLDFCNELLKNQVLNNQAIQSPSLVGNMKQSRVNVVSTGTTGDNLSTNEQQSINTNKFESTV